jgi:phage terminase large subunit
MISPTEFCVKKLNLIPYLWQIEAMESVAMGQPTSVVAANGSGKTDRLVAVLVLWCLYSFPKAKVVFTSGSYRQLMNQLWPAIRKHRTKFPAWNFLSEEIRTPEGGFALGFSTDDPGRAEGWHGEADAPLFLIIDEAKTVPDAIFEAFDRCTRAFELWVSSPGMARGQFYDSHHKNQSLYWTRKVPSTECPHIPESRREQDRIKYGVDHPLYRSKHLAEFTADNELMILSSDKLKRALENQPKPETSGEVVSFCDFAAGRDENCLAVRRGNVAKVVKAWTERDTVQGARQFVRLFESEGLKPGQIWGDADGLGTVMIDQLAEMGWHINRFHGGQAAKESDEYANLIGEVWHSASLAIQRGEVYLGELDPTTFDQITTRKSEWTLTGKLRCEDKEKMRKNGLKSPDRADALLAVIALGAHHSGAMTAKSNPISRPSPFSMPAVRNFNAF